MIDITAQRGSLSSVRTEGAAVIVPDDKNMLRRHVASIAALTGTPARACAPPAFSGKTGQTFVLHPPGMHVRHVILVGIGPASKITAERLRRSAAAAVRTAAALRLQSLAILAPSPDVIRGISLESELPLWEGIGAALAEGALLGSYRYDAYLSAEKKKESTLTQVQAVYNVPSAADPFTRGVRRARTICNATCLARDLTNAPGNEIYPETLAARARSAGRKAGFRVTVLDERRIKQLGMGGLLGVSQGSARPPRFIVMDYAPPHSKGTIVLVGKGITFDAGGISIKPSANMADMKMDMAGGAAVIGTLQAAAELGLPLHIVGLVPATENLPGGRALKPGDILTHLNGITSEIDNTDAEGRLVLADALAYAQRYKPDLIVDLATLTGACVVALGYFATGMFGNSEDKMLHLIEAGERTYERVWQLPMFEEYEKLVASTIADVKNDGGRWGGAITAAMFLKKFVGSSPWIHLDIAGTAMAEEPQEYIPRGGTGVGVRLLADFLSHWNSA